MSATLDRVRADGWRPSIYGCNRRRSSNIDCRNKYISDIVVGPFVFNYIANIIRAKDSVTKRTGLVGLEKKLLRGDMFSDVDHIDVSGLTEMYEALRSGKFENVLYASKAVESYEESPEVADERDLLASEKRKKERALARLKSLYYYDDEGISETEYIVERKAMLDAIATIDKRLEEIELSSSSHFSLSDEEFIAKASFFIMNQHLQNKRFIEFEKLVRKIDTKIIKEFVNSIVKKIVIKDGRVMAIRFKNGIEHKFLYKL